MADVFVSYKREDSAKVRKLVAALRGQGLAVWWDEDIPASAPWEATIERELAQAKAVVVCWSPASVASENVRSEARVARENGRLIQLFLKPCTPPLFFGERQGIDLAKWRGDAADPRIAKIADAARALARGKRIGTEGPFIVRKRRASAARIAASIAALILIAGAALGWWLLAPARASGPQTLAVLPFRALNADDTNLVDAIWDDTRGAISRNPNLRVLGRQTVEKLADNHLEPADYRKKLGVDYLLDGNVQHSGERIVMNISLVRTEDGAEVWNEKIATKLDDIFAVQSRIASNVEGKIRGRVAPGGGVTAKNIATSGEVYALYAEARAHSRKRTPDDFREAAALLKKALAADPNYAPAWAELGFATYMTPRHLGTMQKMRSDPVRYIKRALDLAPNLAHAHAALAMVQYAGADSEAQMRRAIALDPNDYEAWMWLGGQLANQNRVKEALVAFTRAAEIEPLQSNAVGNRIQALQALGRTKDVKAEIERIRKVGDPILLYRILVVAADGPGDALRILLEARSRYPSEAGRVDQRVGDFLQQLDFVELAQQLNDNPPSIAADYRGYPEAESSLWGGWDDPNDIWMNFDAPSLLARILPKNGRLQEYMRHYHAAFRSADDFLAANSDQPLRLVNIAPTVAVTLRSGGEEAQADSILRRTEPMLLTRLRNGPADPGMVANLAYYRAAEGLDDQAVALLQQAVAGGWLPDNQYFAKDLADEPCFARLVKRPDFLAIRNRILQRIADERRKVPLDLLAQAYSPRKAAA